MFVVKLYNPSDRTINAMFDGTPYTLPAKGVAHVPQEAAGHFVVYYSGLGLRVLDNENADGEVVQEAEAAQTEHTQGDAVCPVCGKDFSDRERPAVALRRHMKAVHEGETSDGEAATDL
jgi:hypothetical protein